MNKRIITLLLLLSCLMFSFIYFFKFNFHNHDIDDQETHLQNQMMNMDRQAANGENEHITNQVTEVQDSIKLSNNGDEDNRQETNNQIKPSEGVFKNILQYINRLPSKGAFTNSILTANDEDTQRQIIEFSEKIRNDIFENDGLSNKDKQELLWKIYSEIEWRGDDNAFQAVVSDALLALDLSDILPDMITYYETSTMQKSIRNRSNLMRIIMNNFAANKGIVNKLCLKQILAPQSIEETQEISDYVLMRYIEGNNSDEIEKNIGMIISSAESDENRAYFFINTLFVSAVQSSTNMDIMFDKLFNAPLGTFSQKALNDSLVFQLSEDKNFSINMISKRNLNIIRNYIDKNNLDGKQWDIVKNRINEALQNS